ncbi:MAG: FAD-dependent thymidylate synthase [Deferribacteraceae bacterium]|jgi:thymidylate synthase (FAD)|nr:FAD-dependent thymidylate synthase [Deferribacteraceae bacterium]
MNTGSLLKVELLAHTGGELVAALAAKLCYSGADIAELVDKVAPNGLSLSSDEQASFLEKIASMGHHSVFEHLSFTFGIEGVSRALTHQLVRHRIASYSQKSQRYVAHGTKLVGDKQTSFPYIIPPEIAANDAAITEFNNIMSKIAEGYDKLAALGIAAEDARYLLPNACETKIIVTMNARELLHFFQVRCCTRAQWEIREMATQMLAKAYPIAPSIFSKAGPACVGGACSEGKMSCGKASEVRQKFVDLLNS